MVNLFFLLLLLMFNFLNIGTNRLKKEDRQHQSKKYAHACVASFNFKRTQYFTSVTTSDYK